VPPLSASPDPDVVGGGSSGAEGHGRVVMKGRFEAFSTHIHISLVCVPAPRPRATHVCEPLFFLFFETVCRRRAGRNTNLEKSLDSLSLFRTSHAGRIGISVFEPAPLEPEREEVIGLSDDQPQRDAASGPTVEAAESEEVVRNDSKIVSREGKHAVVSVGDATESASMQGGNRHAEEKREKIESDDEVAHGTKPVAEVSPKKAPAKRVGLFEQIAVLVEEGLLGVDEGDRFVRN